VVFANLYIALLGLVVIISTSLTCGSIRVLISRRGRFEVDARTSGRPLEAAPDGADANPKRKRFRLSEINRRRWRNFKSNRRGYYSFWIFLILFFISMFAEFIANDRPFLVKYDGRFYFPAVVTYAETTFGGEFETKADYREPVNENMRFAHSV
jgi:hypothetical protein